MNGSGKDVPVRFSIKLYSDNNTPNELVKSLNTGKVRRVHHVINTYHWERAWLKVCYSETDKSLCNEGEFTTLKELQDAITAFTDPELLAYIRGHHDHA